MSAYIKISVAAVCCALCAVALRRHHAEFSVLLTITGCCLGGIFLMELLSPVISFIKDLFAKTGLDNEMLTPLLKALGIGFVTQIAASICMDAGESALAKTVELGGSVLCVCVSLPLLSAVLALVQRMAGD